MYNILNLIRSDAQKQTDCEENITMFDITNCNNSSALGTIHSGGWFTVKLSVCFVRLAC